MKISKTNLENASIRIGLSKETSEQLWTELEKENSSRFNLENLAYYFGAMIILSAMGWFLTEAWDSLGGLGIAILGVSYALVFTLAGIHFWFKKQLKTPGGLLFTVAVWVIPLIVFGIELYTGLWPQDAQDSFHDYHVWVRGSWIIMEITTILGGLITLYYIRFPFLTFPIAFSLWYLSMDITSIFFGQNEFTWEQRQLVSIYFGLGMLIVSYLIDCRTKEDYSFWIYLFGMIAFWGSLSSMNSNSELNKFFYCLINLFLILVSVILQRKVFIVFGSMGVFGYLGHLAFSIFEDSLLFPIVLTAFGFAIIYCGVWYRKNKAALEAALLKILPGFLLKLSPDRRSK